MCSWVVKIKEYGEWLRPFWIKQTHGNNRMPGSWRKEAPLVQTTLLCPAMTISIVTPTYFRYKEVPGLLEALRQQTLLPHEVVLVDGAPAGEMRTEEWVKTHAPDFPFTIQYLRKQGGTAIQRNYGMDAATGDFIFFFDDDVRPDTGFIKAIVDVFRLPGNEKVGGVTGFRTNKYFTADRVSRWRWYKKLKLLSVFEGGKYDYRNGYPINNNMVAPFTGTREVDFMTTACSAYRKEVFATGLRFDAFFVGYGILEDAHLSLSAKKQGWKLLQCGDATAVELSSPSGRTRPFVVAERTCYNYYYVFKSICGPLSMGQRWRFYRFQGFEWFRAFVSMFSHPGSQSISYFLGKGYGIWKTLTRL
jgi:GT2 family glycosyltransferase